MDGQELFDEVINDVSDKYASREILLLWSKRSPRREAARRGLQRFKTRFAPYFAEFTAEEHPPTRLTARYRANAPRFGRRPANCGADRNLWCLWPRFIGALRAAR